MFEKLNKTESKVSVGVDPEIKARESGKDYRTFKTKAYGWLKIIAIAYLLAVHLFACLYFTNTKLVLRVEAAPKLVSPLAN